MTSVCQMPEKDVILKLLEIPIPDSQLFAMSSTELQGLSFGIDRLAVVFRGEPQLLSGLRELDSRVKSAENYVGLMNSLDGFLEPRTSALFKTR
jgi:hypothetical protein